ncbi:MAG: M24 family metallopeptidase [Candidatus Methanoperedens sp.]|nr:M24 family metallopeptidase [Candidatus Methanoperedens sp.]
MNQTELTDREMEGYLEARDFARGLGKEIVSSIRAGMTEKEIEDIAYDVFRTNGVKHHWHMPIIGAGEGSTKLKDLYSLASSYLTKYSRILHENDIVLIDIAPVYNEYPSDYTLCHVSGSNPDLEALAAYAQDISCRIARSVKHGMTVSDVFRRAKELIADSEYTLAYPPLISMGHRICRLPPSWQRLPEPGLTYLLLRARAPFITPGNNTPMSGLWVIEPYLMYKERAAKFEALVFVGKETVILDRKI